MIARKLEYTTGSQIEFLGIKTTMSEKKNTLNGINRRLSIAETKISEFIDIAIKIIQNKTGREKT